MDVAATRVATPTCTASFSRQGAQVTGWAPIGHSEVIFLSDLAQCGPDTPIRGGIPVVFPWFGPGRTPGMLPAHGFARSTPWSLVGLISTPETVTATHALTSEQATSNWFPHPYVLDLSITFGTELRLDLTTHNTGTESFSFEQALHTYLRVGDVQQIVVEGLDGTDYLDQAAGGLIATQADALRISGAIDRIYQCAGSTRVTDPVLDRVITITKSGSQDTVIWNPWQEGAAALADLRDDAWPEMLCVESANVKGSAISLEPGSRHTMTVIIGVERL